MLLGDLFWPIKLEPPDVDNLGSISRQGLSREIRDRDLYVLGVEGFSGESPKSAKGIPSRKLTKGISTQ